MTDKPNIVCEIGARAYGSCMLAFFAVVWVAAVAFAVAFPSLPGWWVVCWIAAATFTVAFIGVQLIPLVVRGGAYRDVPDFTRSSSHFLCLTSARNHVQTNPQIDVPLSSFPLKGLLRG